MARLVALAVAADGARREVELARRVRNGLWANMYSKTLACSSSGVAAGSSCGVSSSCGVEGCEKAAPSMSCRLQCKAAALKIQVALALALW